MAAFTMPDPGKMCARLTLQQPMDTFDGQGGVARNWQDVATLWAQVEPQSVSREEQGEAEIATVTHAITLRHRVDLARGWRLAKGSRIFTIRAWRDPDESQRFLVLDCAEELA
ncbi:SPP1 family predicted phage head-tail adaptor [Agrobacterium vitis]|nr:SPP1 family predicted phage head-tail adaptor [Agrobacterium vitis]MBE1439203.1 SPP1 family predicted phage head-tail adaptor [Agrobacterium vitis]